MNISRNTWWMLALATYGVGDIVTTRQFIGSPFAAEWNPHVQQMYDDAGRTTSSQAERLNVFSLTLARAKMPSLVVAWFVTTIGSRFVDDEDRIWSWNMIPASFALIGGFVTLWNLHGIQDMKQKESQWEQFTAGFDYGPAGGV